MKALKIVIVLAAFCAISNMTTAQVNLALNGSVHSIGDFEFSYNSYGILVEGNLGDNFSIGMSAERGTYNQAVFYNFNPSIKFYTNESFSGLYAGIGIKYFNVKSKGDQTLMFPLPEETSTSFYGPELKLGISTIVDDMLTFGLEAHAGKSIDLDEMFYGANFSIGVYLY